MENRICAALAEASLPSPPPAALRAAVQGEPRADRVMQICVHSLADCVVRAYKQLPFGENKARSLDGTGKDDTLHALVVTGAPMLHRFVAGMEGPNPLRGRELLLAFAWLAEAMLEHQATQAEADADSSTCNATQSAGREKSGSMPVSMRPRPSAGSRGSAAHGEDQDTSQGGRTAELDVAGGVRAALTEYRRLQLDLREHVRLQRQLIVALKPHIRKTIGTQQQRTPMSPLEIMREPRVWRAVCDGTAGGGRLPRSLIGRRQRQQPRSAWWAWIASGAPAGIPRNPALATGHHHSMQRQQDPDKPVESSKCGVPLVGGAGLPVYPGHMLAASTAKSCVIEDAARQTALAARVDELRRYLAAWQPLLPLLRERATLARQGNTKTNSSLPSKDADSERVSVTCVPLSERGTHTRVHAERVTATKISCAQGSRAVRGTPKFDQGTLFGTDNALEGHDGNQTKSKGGFVAGEGFVDGCHRNGGLHGSLGEGDAGVAALREEHLAILKATSDYIAAAHAVAFRGT